MRCPVLADSGYFVQILVGYLVPEDGGSFLRGHGCFDRRDLVGPPFVVVDGLQLPGQFHAFLEGGLASLKDLVPDRLLDTGQKELVFEEQSHVIDTFLLDVGWGGAGGGSDSVDGVGPVVDQAVIGYLHPAAIIVH